MWQQLIDIFGGNLLGGVKDLIQTFKLPPEQQLQFEQAMAKMEADFRAKALELEISDRASARAREMAVKDKTPAVLAFISVGGFLGISMALLANFIFYPEVKVVPEAMGLIGTLIGYLSGKSELALAYYFGSSRGSDRKTELLTRRE